MTRTINKDEDFLFMTIKDLAFIWKFVGIDFIKV